MTRWLLLRGLAREAEHWHDFPDHLSAALGLPRGRLRAHDLPGFGSESAVAAPWSVKETVVALRSRWHEGHAATARSAVLGISLGAMVALEWVARFPDDFERAVAINPSDRRTSRPYRRLWWRSLPLMLRIAICRDLAVREELTLRLTANRPDDERRRAILRRRIEIAQRRQVRPVNVLRQLVAAARWGAPQTVGIPLLVIASRGDRMVDPSCAARLAMRLGTPLAVHPWGGHDLTVDASKWVAEAIASWTGDSRLIR